MIAPAQLTRRARTITETLTKSHNYNKINKSKSSMFEIGFVRQVFLSLCCVPHNAPSCPIQSPSQSARQPPTRLHLGLRFPIVAPRAPPTPPPPEPQTTPPKGIHGRTTTKEQM